MQYSLPRQALLHDHQRSVYKSYHMDGDDSDLRMSHSVSPNECFLDVGVVAASIDNLDSCFHNSLQ